MAHITILPGQFEQRTGNPFVTYQVLAGSMCANRCGEYENCYSPKSQMPQQPCKPTSIYNDKSPEELLQIRTDRANTPQFPIMTVAHILDKALLRAGLWREGWNGRQNLRGNPELPAKPGSIYLSNMVKCRSCKPRANGNGWEDDTPSKENMDACTEWLEIQIYIIQPSIIVAMGNPAIAGTTGISDPKVLKMRGNVYPSKLGVPVLAEVHPSFISRQSPQDQEVYVDHFVGSLERAKEIASGDYALPWMVQGGISMGSSTSFPSPLDMEFNVSTFPEE